MKKQNNHIDINKGITADVKTEYFKCADSPFYFMNNYVKIQTPTHKKYKLNLYNHQIDVLKSLINKKNNIICKGRVIGITTLLKAYIMWLTIFKKNSNIIIITCNKPSQDEFINGYLYIYNNLPSWLIIPKISNTENEKILSFSNGTKINVLSAATELTDIINNIKNNNISHIILDEAAFINNIENIWDTIKQYQLNTNTIVTSTPNNTKWFSELWSSAITKPDTHSTMTLPWDVIKTRTKEWRKKQTKYSGNTKALLENDCITSQMHTII